MLLPAAEELASEKNVANENGVRGDSISATKKRLIAVPT
jgi:hypothetical protein